MSTRARIQAACTTPPMPHQVKGVRFLNRREGRGIIADEQGLGKTYQVIAYLKLHPEVRPAVVVCPATLKYNWQREFSRHANLKADVAEGREPFELAENIWILNYDILPYWLAWLTARKPVFLAVDEFQKIGNHKAKRTVATVTLGSQCRQAVGLSGTPISNGPVEFFPMLHIIAPDLFPAFMPYAFKFCGPRQGFRGHWDFRGASNVEELHELVSPLMIRRLKADVLTDLPPVVKTFIPLKVDLKEYNIARQNFIQWLGERRGKEAVKRARGAEGLVRLGQLRMLAGRAKLPAVVEWLKDWTGGKLVVFGIHKAAVVEYLADQFPGYPVVTGGMSPQQKEDSIAAFQNGDAPMIFGNLKALGVGHTLTAGQAAAHVEFSWVPNDHEQGDARCHRIGSTGRIESFYFVALGTTDEYLMELIETKRDVIGQVVDGLPARVHEMVIEKLLRS